MPPSSLSRVYPSPMASKQAVEELRVFLRTMSVAQRRWTREIASCESQVRRLMMEEDQCRERLRRIVLRGAYDHLKYLVSTDLLSSSQEGLAQPISLEQFRAYGISPSTITPFAVYVMSRLAANPSKIEGVSKDEKSSFSFQSLIAEYQAGWAVLSPQGKAHYENLANSLQAEGRREDKKKKLLQPLKKREKIRLMRRLRVGKREVPNVDAHETMRRRDNKKKNSRSRLEEVSTEATNTTSTPHFSGWEKKAFDCYLQSSFTQMSQALSSPSSLLLLGPTHSAQKKKAFPLQHWVSIANNEWNTFTEEQKKLYLPRTRKTSSRSS